MKYLKKQQYFSVTCSQDCHTWDMNFVNFPWNLWCAGQAIDQAMRYLTHDDTQVICKANAWQKRHHLSLRIRIFLNPLRILRPHVSGVIHNFLYPLFRVKILNIHAMKSGYFFIQWCHKIEPSPLQWIFKAVLCAMLWLLYFLDFNFKCATSWRTESESGYV